METIETIQCGVCGKVIERTAPSRKYCDACAKARRYRKNKERIARLREEKEKQRMKEAMGQSNTKLLHTLTTKGKSTPRVIAEARAFGMSYGTYTAAIRDGSINSILKSKGFSDPKTVLKSLDIK